MTSRFAIAIVAAVTLALPLAGAARQAHPSFAGTWTLDREHSDMPKEVGFDVKIGAPGSDDDTSGRGRGRGGNPLTASARFESEEEAHRRQVLTEEVRTPPATITIAEPEAAVTIRLPQQPDRVFRPAVKEEMQPLADGHVLASAKWVGPVLEVRYTVGKDLVLRYRYSRADDHAPLVVEASLLNKNKGETIKRVYVQGKG